MSVSTHGIAKAFAGVRALRGVDLTVADGEVHALLGPNGSGKSTLAKVLAGVHQPDAGSIEIGGRSYHAIASPTDAAALGIRVVHQESPLVDSFSVAECMALFGDFPTRGGRIRWPEVRRIAARRLEALGASIDPRALAGSLAPAERAVVALAIALGETRPEDTSLLILDEATASIPEAATGQFLDQAKALAAQGVPVLMVTHRMREVFRYADRITMLVNGALRFAGTTDECDEEQLVDLMVGAPAEDPAAGRPAAARRRVAPPASSVPGGADRADSHPVAVRDLRTATLQGIDIVLSPGQIVGVVGGPESGAAELPAALVGDHPGATGTLELHGARHPLPRSPREALQRGIVLVPRDRLRGGGVGSLSVRENVLLPAAGAYWHRGERADAAVRRVFGDFDVHPPDERALFASLSGGNQQKVVIGKWLSVDPRVLVLDDPTSGVDPGARRKIFDVLVNETRKGLSVVLLSTEPEQIVELCSRVVAIERGRVAREYDASELTAPAVARWAAA